MYHFPVERKIFQVHMPLFWVWSSTANFWKTSKKNNILNVKSVNPSCNITKRPLDNGVTMEEVLLRKSTVNFVLQNLGFVINKETCNGTWNQVE